MPENLPEATFDRESFKNLFASLSNSLLEFEITETTFINHEHQDIQFCSVDDLLSALQDTHPLNRRNIKLAFKYKKSTDSRNKISGSISFGSERELSQIRVEAGTFNLSSTEESKISRYFEAFRRPIPNRLIKEVYSPLILIGLFLLSLKWPFTTNSATLPIAVVSAFVSTPIIAFCYFRPHIFFSFRYNDIFRIFPAKLSTAAGILVLAAILWAILQTPIWIGRDSELVATNQQLQTEVLRRIITPEFLYKIEALRESNKLYDKADSKAQKQASSKLILDQLYELIGNRQGLRNFPIDQLPYFISSAHRMQEGNWLAEPLLLMAKVSFVEGEVTSATFQMHIDSGKMPNRNLTFDEWLRETVIKDKYGRTWTRKSLVEDKKADSLGDLKGERLNDLTRLREFPDDGMALMSLSGKQTFVENTIEEDSVRAISEELVRSMYTIQRNLSENPQEFKP